MYIKEDSLIGHPLFNFCIFIQFYNKKLNIYTFYWIYYY